MEFNETWQEASSQCLLPRLCFSGQSGKNKIAAPAYDLLRHFQLFLWNCWIEFNKTWQEARSQHPLLGLHFSGRSEKQDSTLSSDWLRHFPLLLWNHWTECNETWQKASSQRPLPSLCFSGWSKKQYGRPSLWLAETYFDFSSETAKWNSAKIDRKQDLNVLYQVCVFRAEKWIKITTLANPSKKVAHFKTFFSPEGYSNKSNA